jgi:hypothetical protein
MDAAARQATRCCEVCAARNVGGLPHSGVRSRAKSRARRRPAVSTTEPLLVVADYRFSPFGTGCLATLAMPKLPARTVYGTDVHDVLHQVMDEIGRLADEQHRGLLTMHLLNDDPRAFAEIAHRDGFESCLHYSI